MSQYANSNHDLQEHLSGLRERFLTNPDGEDAVICAVDGYPSTMVCTCTHGHDRHVGTDEIRCSAYTGQPDCDCTTFTPDAASVSALWLAHCDLITRLDLGRIASLIPQIKTESSYVRDWPEDEQAVWDCVMPDRNAAIYATHLYRRQKVALAILRSIVGMP